MEPQFWAHVYCAKWLDGSSWHLACRWVLFQARTPPPQFSADFWVAVCKTVRPMVSDRCLSVCLAVTFMHCGQTVGRIKMKLGTRVGIGPGHIELDGDPPTPSQKGHSLPIFDPYQLRPNGCMDQDVTWYGARRRPRRLFVRGKPRSPSQKGERPPIFGPCLLWPNGWINAPGTWRGGRPQIRRLCVRWGASSPSPKGGGAPLPNFRPISIVSKTAERIKMPLGTDVGLSPGDFVLDGDPVHLSKRGRSPPPKKKNRSMFIVVKPLNGSRCHLARR